MPLFQLRGCASCHSGSSGSAGFSVLTPQEVLAGGSHGPAVIPRRAGESLLVLKLIDPPFGSRMPVGAPRLADEEILTISDWVDQGARDN